MKLIKMILAILAWIPMSIVSAVLWLSGWIVIWYCDRYTKLLTMKSRNPDKGWITTIRPRLLSLWGNDEDGIYGPEVTTAGPSDMDWAVRAQNWSDLHRALSWYLRNPVANERFSKLGVYLCRSKMDRYGNSDNPWEDWKFNEDYSSWLFDTHHNDSITINPDRDSPHDSLWINISRPWAYWCLARQGCHAGLWIVTDKRTYRVGSKVYPGYTREIDRYQGMFTLQRRKNRL